MNRWEIPDNWEWTTIESIADVVAGGTPNAWDESNFSDDGTPWITPADLTGYHHATIQRGRRGLSAKGLESSSAKVLPAGAVLFSSRAPIGYCVVAANPIATNQGFKNLILREGIDPHFVRHYLRSSKDYAESQASGTTFPELSAARMKLLEFPLPPLAEQHRIVAKVEELTARSRAARAALAEVPTLLEQFRQSVLASAFRGDLTADWRAKNPNAEPASVLLDRIRAERREQWETKYPKKKYVAPEPVYDSDLPELPEGWCWGELALLGEDLFNPIQTGPFGAQLHSSEFVTQGVPVIAVGNLTGHGFSRENLYFITEQKAKLLSRYAINAGDLLFARSGATLGKVCVAPEYVDGWRMTGHILRARLNQRLIRSRLVALAIWGMPAVKGSVTSRVRGMTRPGFNTTLLEEIPIPIPPLPEQDELLHKVDDAFSKIDQIEASIGILFSELDTLDQSILAKAFRGELVPQDPADEPAEVLLERLRADRELAAGTTPAKRARRTPSPKGRAGAA